jgi:flagellar biogenesis protein FliO
MTKKEHVDLLTRLVTNKQITLLEAFELYEFEVFDPEIEEEEEEEEEEESEDEFVKNFLEYVLNNPTSTTTNLNDYLNKKK